MAFLNAPQMGRRRHSLFTHSDSMLAEDDDVRLGPIQSQLGGNSDTTFNGYSTSSDDNMLNEDTMVVLNVGGKIFKTYINTLKKIKGTKLEAIAQQCHVNLNNCKSEYFFDRNPHIFASVLDYCRYNELHIPKNVCVMLFRKELEYWGLCERHISECCRRQFNDGLDEIRLHEMLTKEFKQLKPKRKCTSVTTRETIYHILHYPETSLAAKIWAGVYYLLVCISVCNIFLSTVPECRVPVSGTALPTLYSNPNHAANQGNNATPISSEISDSLLKDLETNSKLRMMVTTTVTPAIRYIDLFCLFYFTIEFIARLLTVPKRFHIFKDFFTLCDLMYLIPVWILWIGQLVDEKFWRTLDNIPIFLTLQCFIVARFVALFRVATQYRALRILVLSLRASMGEIFLLLVFVFFAMVVYSSIIYCTEIFIVGSMGNMFDGLWWSLITMTTVGYGDMVPESGLGYFVGCVCALTGIILIGMVVPIITSNFHKYYGFRYEHSDDDSPTPEIETVENTISKTEPVSPTPPILVQKSSSTDPGFYNANTN